MRAYVTAQELLNLGSEVAAPWRDRAACRGLPNVMDPPTKSRDDLALAKLTCHRCPVMEQCADWVLRLPTRADPGGICAGLTEAERGWQRLRQADPDAPAPRKRCSRCHKRKPVTDFTRDRHASDGLNSSCRPCHTEMTRARRARKAHR